MSISFTVEEHGNLSHRTVIDGVAIVVRSTVVIAKPASITKEQLLDYLREHAVNDRDDDGSDNWVLRDDPAVGDIDMMGCESLEALATEVANTLNDIGVSISDWPVYQLEDCR